MKSKVKIAGTLMAIISIALLLLPIYKTQVEGGEGWTVILRGINLVEFSPWGGLTILIPVLILGIMYSKLDERYKMLGVMVLYTLNSISLYNANFAMFEWLNETATNYIYRYGTLFVYMGSLFIAALLFYIHCNIKQKNELLVS